MSVPRRGAKTLFTHRIHALASVVVLSTSFGCETFATLRDPVGEFEVTVRKGELVERRDDDVRFRVDADVMSVQRHTLSRFDAERTLDELTDVLTRRHAAELAGAPLVWTPCEWVGRTARCARGHVELDGVRHERRGVLWRTNDVVAWLDVTTRASGAAIDDRVQGIRDGWRWIEGSGET